MLSVTEKRFIRYWQEQREGGKLSYYTMYILVGTFMATLIISTFLFLFFQIIFGSIAFWSGLLAAFVISVVAAVTSWTRNERKFKELVKREMKE